MRLRRATAGGKQAMQNVLFVLDREFSSNSAIHVHALANELSALGLDCVVAVPHNKQAVAQLGPARYVPLNFGEAGQLRKLFPNGAGPDVVHSWTPREIVRKFCDGLQKRFQFKLFIHLEDNEEYLLEKIYLRGHLSAGAELLRVPDSMSHPVRYREFLRRAAGVTVIIEKLKEFAPPATACLTLWPGVDTELFSPRLPATALCEQLALPPGHTVIVYTGNVHQANALEVRSLYLAVALLNREGHPTCLVRTGTDYCDYLDDHGSWVKPYVRALGQVPREQIPGILALADLFVQPGRAGRFNEYRFPSKVPEFLALGKPVILPRANIAHALEHARQAWVVERADGVQIVEAVQHLCAAPALAASIGAGGLEFARTRLSWPKQAALLRDFYLAA